VNLYSHSSACRQVATLLAGAAALMLAQAASAGVVPSDKFSFDISGSNYAGTTDYSFGGGTATFGQSSTVKAANGVSYTITSSQVVGAKNTTDTFTVTAPSNFLTANKFDNTTIAKLQFAIGGTDPVDFSSPVSKYADAGYIVGAIGKLNVPVLVAPHVTLASNDLSFSATEEFDLFGAALYSSNLHEFDFTITYANPVVSAVPETSNWALLLAGLGGMTLVARRSRKS